jgi:hypothetical protein
MGRRACTLKGVLLVLLLSVCFGGWADAIPISVNFTYTIGAVPSIQPQ